MIGWLLVWCLFIGKCIATGDEDNVIKSMKRRPNILIILADDVGTGDIPAYWGSGKVEMPNIDSLADKGVLFTDAHSTPLCAPSRYALLSGNYQHRGTQRSGTWKMGTRSQFAPGQQSIAQVLRDGGNYHTFMAGKWHLGGKIPRKKLLPRSAAHQKKSRRRRQKKKPVRLPREGILRNKMFDWTRPLGQGPQDLGFDSSYITSGGIQSPPYAWIRDGYVATNISEVIYWERGSFPMREGISMIREKGEGARDWDSTAYNMILVNETNAFLDEHMKSRPEDPFFAYVALGSVHIPHSPPFAYLDGTKLAGEHPTSHMDVLKEMDLVVGSLVEALEKRELIEDTIIVFTSDNGGLSDSLNNGQNSNGPLREQKGSIYEGGHRIPLIMRYDGVFPARTSLFQLVGINDLFATLCGLAGIPVPEGQARDSVSFAKYIVNGETEGLREYLGLWRFFGASPGWHAAIRKNEFKLVAKIDAKSLELYDLSADLSETNDLSYDPKYQKLKNEMLTELNEIGPFVTCEGLDVVEIKRLGGSPRCCSWAAKNPRKRCTLYPEVRMNCPEVCVAP